jgi:hypothetical protein
MRLVIISVPQTELHFTLLSPPMHKQLDHLDRVMEHMIPVLLANNEYSGI